jgi:hypothetical protein
MLLAALAWSRIVPGSCNCLGFVTIPTFWWHLGAVGMLAGLALFAGWLQDVLQYHPVEVAVEPPAHHDHGHGHDHGHDHGHGHH